ncbi:glycosyltransferase family 4 protein [Caulobacter hibisci]|uniref:Glycosyltransferase family 4 protein n=1 Tax=Caulobacter hibisci TaxID=2035993 RepID=A0ABS0T6A0_9CAUL|nr:glycosyltransferase family 4 protein [Caulobacter hibisci]
MATFELVTGLQRDQQRRCVFLVAKGTPIADEAERLGIEVIDTGELDASHWTMRRRRNPFFALKRLPARLRLLRRIGSPFIVHCNDILEMQSFGFAAKLLGGKVVYHHHALNRMIFPNRLLVGVADAVIAVSEICLQAVAFVGADKARYVLNPIEVGLVDRGAARSRVCAALGIDPSRVLAGFVGNFWERKRPLFFLEAAAAMLAKRPDLHFILFGRRADYEIEDLEARAQALGLGERITFAGFLMPAEDNIAAIDLLMAPAVNEPFGRTPIEAGLLGTPYVATDDAGHAEIGRRWGGGRLVPLQDEPGQFAETALAVLAAPDEVLLGPSARAAVVEDFSIRAHAAAVEAVYRRLEGARQA